MLRELLIRLSENDSMRRFASNFGPARRMARRFVAGETLDDAVTVVKSLAAQGIKAIFNEVGESVESQAEARLAAQNFCETLQRIKAEGVDASISVKPSHLGLHFGQDFCYDNLASIVEQAQALGILVEIDIEGSADVEATLALYARLLDRFGGGVRQAIQTYLHRTPTDLTGLIERGANIRLVKGAYREPPEIAIQDKKAITNVSKELISRFLTPEARARGAYLALGSHDPVLIEWLIEEANAHAIEPNEFEFQMLQGVRREEQRRLAKQGYQVRIYVPYGAAWYPYFMRRLAERPANLIIIIRAFDGR
jgi:proline dehydrogenase